MADAASNGALRPLLPRPPPDQSPAPPPPQSPSTPQKKNVIAACDLCRKRRVKCNGERPSCHECTARQRECVYSTQPAETRVTALKRKHGQLESELERLRNSHLALFEVVEAMKTSNRTDALAILQRIRDGVDIEAVARSISIGDILLQLRVAPETRYRYVFPYRTDMPLSIRKRSDVPYMRSAVYEVMSVTAGPNAEPQETHFGMDDHATPQFYKPYHASAIEDPRLDAVKPSMWTTISDDDDLMRTLLRLYFLHEYHWLSCFCKDHFLDDMLSGKKHFCSSLLVNVILAQACHCHLAMKDRWEHWNPTNLGYKFFSEARRLWEISVNEKASITVVQAAMVFNMILNVHSMDQIGFAYISHAVSMAHDLNIFAPASAIKGSRKQHCYAITAWNLYWWTSLQSYHFLVAPLIKEPPQTPLPDPDQYPEWYGETFLRYPLSRTLVPMHFGHLANSKFRLAVIINSLVGHLFSPTGSTPPASQTISEYLPKLTSWFTSLPKCLGPSEIVFPVQLKLHLGYHNLITNLCELHTDDSSEPIDESTLGTIRAHLSHSRVCFEALLRLYYLRHGFEYADTYLTHELSVLGFRAFENCQNLTSTTDGVSVSPDELSDARSTLILAAKGLNEQGLNYYTPFNILCVLVNQMDAYELDMLRKCVSIRSEDSLGNQFRTRHIKAQYPCGISNMTKHPKKQRLGELVKKYTSLALESTESGTTSDDESS